MYTSPGGSGGSGPGGGPYQPSTPHNIRTDTNTTNDVHGNSNTGTDFANVLNGYNHTVSVRMNEKSVRIQEWLSPLEPNTRHEDVSSRRLDGIGDWVLQKTEFESWRQSLDGPVNPTLLCHGGQGVGKTYISSLVIDTLSRQARGKNIAVLFVYCDYQARKDQSATNIIGSLLRQVSIAATRVPDEISVAFEESKQGGGKRLRLPDMLKLFVSVISSMERAYICVDAVDELPPRDRSEFLRALRQVVQEASNARLFLTGRPYIRRELDKHLTRGAYIIHLVPDQGDITRYLNRKIDDDDDRDPDLMTENLKDDIVKTMLEKASEMFLLVALNIDEILGEASLARRKRMLEKVATTGVGLGNVYDQTLQRIREQRSDRSRLGMEVLMWVSYAKRPLRIDELCHALAIEMGTSDLNRENIPPQDTVLGSCLGLVAVDKETSVVRLIHYTLREYLSLPGILPNAHKTLA